MSAQGRVWAKLLGVLALLWLLQSSIFAQTADKWLAKGDASYAEKSYSKALEYYSFAAKRKMSPDAALGIANCNRKLGDQAQAIIHYRIAVQDAKRHPESLFYLGQSLLGKKRYAEAQVWFGKYAEATLNDSLPKFANLLNLVEQVMADSGAYKLQKLPFNSDFADFSPIPFENGLLFISNRDLEWAVVHRENTAALPLMDIYFSEKDSLGSWKTPIPFEAMTTKLNEGPAAWDSTRNELFITRNKALGKKEKRREAMPLEVLGFKHYGDAWVQLPGLWPEMNASIVAHPALSKGGDSLIFASNMPGGMGGLDLYLSTRSDAGWSKPQNLGPRVNTIGDEAFPHFGRDRKFYFASDGQIGLGGYDLFTARAMANGEFGEILNLGFPLNSAADDFGLWMEKDGQNGMVSSNRGNGHGNDDIYRFKKQWPKFDCQPQEKNNYCFVFSDVAILDEDSFPIVYEWDFGDGSTARGLTVRHCFPGAGTYLVELNLIDTTSGAVFMNGVSYEHQIDDIPQVFIDAPDHIEEGQLVTFDASKSVVDDCQVRGYYWEFSDGYRAEGIQIQRPMNTLGQMEVRLGVIGIPQNEDQWKCSQCASKTVEVFKPSAFQEKMEALAKDQAARDLAVSKPDDSVRSSLFMSQSLLLDQASPEKYSVKLMGSEQQFPLDPAKVGDQVKVIEILKNGKYEYHYNLTDSIGEAYDAYVQAKQKGFDEAEVTKLTYEERKQARVLLDSNSQIISGTVSDEEGQPLIAKVKVTEIEGKQREFSTYSDVDGKYEMVIPKHMNYSTRAETEGFFPIAPIGKGKEIAIEPGADHHDLRLYSVEYFVSTGQQIVNQNILFKFDSEQYLPKSQEEIEKMAEVLLAHPELGVVITAYTDDQGTREYNQMLSRKRAEYVRSKLIGKGIASYRLLAFGKGERNPIVPNNSPDNRQLNRRVEFKLYKIKE